MKGEGGGPDARPPAPGVIDPDPKDRDLMHRLRLAYPAGVDWQLDRTVLDANGQAARLDAALAAVSHLVRIEPTGEVERFHEFALTDPATPSFEAWMLEMDDAARIDWIRRRDELYVVLLLRASRVADYYLYDFNHWYPREAGSPLEASLGVAPGAAWLVIAETLDAAFARAGFILASQALLGEVVPFVLTGGDGLLSDEDRGRLGRGSEPPATTACVHDCLFGDG